MSDVIKPEDITKGFVYEVIEKARRSKLNAELGKSASNEQEIADLLNAAIEAGIVSPPCYCVRWNGELQISEQTSVPKLFPGKPWADDTEHYRGQTE